DRRIRFRKDRGHIRECPGSERSAAKFSRHHQSEKARLAKGIDRLRREPAMLVVVTGPRGQHAVGYMPRPGNRCLMVHGLPDIVFARARLAPQLAMTRPNLFSRRRDRSETKLDTLFVYRTV